RFVARHRRLLACVTHPLCRCMISASKTIPLTWSWTMLLMVPCASINQGEAVSRSSLWSPCNGYLEYPFEKMTISSFPPISILAKWNSMKEDAREFFSSFQRNSLNATRFLAEHAQGSHMGDV